ncbi:MAG TPA: OmpH family outer membrane protein [Brumimicrobium sp.]|nr:OmpH family outer membrane protein [Brumimicrobium sp.]
MKQFKSLFVALVLFVGATGFVNAQAKTAHIDVQELIEAMPEAKAAQTELERLRKTYEAEITSMRKELEAKLARYEAEAETKTDAENARRVEEVQSAQGKIGEYSQNASRDLQKKQEDLLRPIFEKATDAIKKVAAEKGYQYVFDATPGGGLIIAEGPDLMADVKKELNI